MRTSRFNNYTLDSVAHPRPSLGNMSTSQKMSNGRVQPHRPAKNKPTIVDYDSSDDSLLFSAVEYETKDRSVRKTARMSPNEYANGTSRGNSMTDLYSDDTSDLFVDDTFHPISVSDRHSYSSPSVDKLTDLKHNNNIDPCHSSMNQHSYVLSPDANVSCPYEDGIERVSRAPDDSLLPIKRRSCE
jgi:hypothetical protein